MKIKYIPGFIVFTTILMSPLFGKALTRNVLFLGNSYTNSTNMPQLIKDLALSLNDTLLFDQNTPGGYKLDQHFADINTTNKIMLGGWDYVVMQEQSQLPSFEEYLSSGPDNLSTLIEQYNPCARKMYFMTWGRKNGDAGRCASWPPVCTYEGMDSLLYLRYLQMAAYTNAEVSPVGYVWRYIRQNHPSIELYWTDGSHPSLAGSYAATACFYSVIFRKDPTLGIFNAGLDSTEAAIIRQAAKLVVYDSLAKWDLAIHHAQATFSYSIGPRNNEVITSNRSTNADYYVWNWGDGTSDSTKNATHNYSADGNYLITLTATKCDLGVLNHSYHQKSVNFCSHTPLIYPDSLIQCPNTTDTLWTQTFNSYQWLDSDANPIIGDTNQFFIPPGGHGYSVEASLNGCTERSASVYVDGYSTGFVIYRVDSFSTSMHPDSLCLGDTVMLILQPNKPVSSDFYFQWYNAGVDIPFATDDTLLVNTSGDYQVKVFNQYCPGYIDFQSSPLLLTFLNCNIGLEEILSGYSIELYPNPAHDHLIVRSSTPFDEKTQWEILDPAGRVALRGEFIRSGENKIAIQTLAKGVYFLSCRDKSRTYRGKFIRN